MKILVCLKQILDPEISPRDFRIDTERMEAAEGTANLVTNIFCENALEVALQIRGSEGGEITALTFGGEQAEDALRKALALKVDRAIRVDNPGIGAYGSAGAALALSAAIKQHGDFDLVLLGRESGDWGEGITAALVAEHLNLPFVSFVDQIESQGEGVAVQRQTDFGREHLNAQVPLVASITNNDANVPRIPKTRDIMMAHRKELTTWTLQDIGLDEPSVRQASQATQLVELFVPEKTEHCEFVSGDTLEQKVAALAKKITQIVNSV